MRPPIESAGPHVRRRGELAAFDPPRAGPPGRGNNRKQQVGVRTIDSGGGHPERDGTSRVFLQDLGRQGSRDVRARPIGIPCASVKNMVVCAQREVRSPVRYGRRDPNMQSDGNSSSRRRKRAAGYPLLERDSRCLDLPPVPGGGCGRPCHESGTASEQHGSAADKRCVATTESRPRPQQKNARGKR